MKDLDTLAFIQLFRAACEKCFGHPLTEALSETESKLLSNTILEKTGLVIGVKSIKNYSIYVLNNDAKKENPSTATLDTLARYVLNAPPSDEAKRKDHESHYPWWFQFRNSVSLASPPEQREFSISPWRTPVVVGSFLLGVFLMWIFLRPAFKLRAKKFSDHFTTVVTDSLTAKGWFIKSVDSSWWNRRGTEPGQLTLYTLVGDNWTDAQHKPLIKNLLLREIPSDCFESEIHLSDFIPSANWEQAGILLLEDTTATSRGVRLSLAYNAFFGGYDKQPEIIIQAINSSETAGFSKPEEIAHLPLFTIDSVQRELIKKNLKHTALKIEKKGKQFRFLYTASPLETFSFKEVVSRSMDLQPRYVGVFAMSGFVDHPANRPVKIDFFSFADISCGE